VVDLERHLPAQWWRSLFNALYLKTDGDVVENDANTVAEVDCFLEATGATPTDRVLDLCCGQGRHALELASRGFTNVSGLDRSRYLIRLARKRAKERGLSVTFHEGDARKPLLPAGSFDHIVIFGNSFGYFDQPTEELKALQAALRLLKPGGTLSLDIVDGQWQRRHFEKRSWEWIDDRRLVCRERSLSSDGERLISREVIIHDEKGVIADQFYAERLYTFQTLQELLKRAGFEAVALHDELQGRSTRNQDLGLMARRLFVVAQAPRMPAPRRRRRSLPRKVTVLLGDPRRPDPVKRDGRFNPEDLETVARLKAALAEIRGVRFEFLDDHSTMLPQLLAQPPEFVFNLCDEGFNNDATMELHVPALLETLGAPYTGAGPVCLGLCYDKSLVRTIASELGVPTPEESVIDADDLAARMPTVFPSFVKPNFGDSSVGITNEAIVRSSEELVRQVAKLRRLKPNEPILVQEFLSGRECTVGLLGNAASGLQALPPLEVDYSELPDDQPPILSYDSKWTPGSPHWERIRYRPAQLSHAEERELVDCSMRLFERLGCRDYARFDFRADETGRFKLLEVNPNPGWCWDGKLNMMAEYAGMSYSQLLSAILEAAFARVSQLTER